MVRLHSNYFRQIIIIFVIANVGFIFILFLSKLVLAENERNLINCNFTRTLEMSMRGNDVACLQFFLHQEGFLKKLPLTIGFYDRETKKAVRRWQIKNKIFPATGIFDARSIDFYIKNYLNKNKEQPTKSLINLPEIKDEEIQISSDGYSDVIEYLKFYFIGINFNKYPDLLEYFRDIGREVEEKKQIPSFFSYAYVKNYLDGKDKNLDALNRRLLFLKRFNEVIKEELKKTKVSPNLKEIHKKFLINSYLEILIIDKFFEYQEKEISKDDLIKILNQYADLRNRLVIETTNKIMSIIGEDTVTLPKRILSLYKILEKVFMVKEAKGQISSLILRPFGGKVLSVTFCSCTFGFTIIVGPPRPAIIFVPITFLSSPLNHLWKMIILPMVWSIGLYIPVLVPCLEWSGEICIPASNQPIAIGLIFRSGTGKFPAPF